MTKLNSYILTDKVKRGIEIQILGGKIMTYESSTEILNKEIEEEVLKKGEKFLGGYHTHSRRDSYPSAEDLIRCGTFKIICTDIIQEWRFSKETINKMSQIIDKTKIIERGGILCGSEETKRINLISECKGDRCSIETDSWKECARRGFLHMGTFHTHPGDILKTQPSIGDLGFLAKHGGLMCIGAPKAKEDRIICIKQKSLSKENELKRNEKLDDMYRLEMKIKNLPFFATKKEREDYDKRYKDIFPGKYYHKFDPEECNE